jgi:beta-glucanase (GH16 family)
MNPNHVFVAPAPSTAVRLQLAARRGLVTLLALIACGCPGGSGSPAVSAAPPPQGVGPGESYVQEAGGLPEGFRLVWADEFEVSGPPDPTRWDYDTDRNRAGWYNHELQYYAHARLENSRVENGHLVLTAQREDLSRAALPDWGGQHYSSARLVTRGKAAWTYGFVELRAKLPCGRGTWPALWMLSAPPATRWPDDGEIDIMEHVGFQPGVVHATMHTAAYNHRQGNASSTRIAVPDACTAFHRYQLSWSAARITVGVDDRAFYQYSNDHSGNAEWPFDSPQYLLLNIAVGGDWGGRMGVDDTIWPVRLEIDYVRVYQQ